MKDLKMTEVQIDPIAIERIINGQVSNEISLLISLKYLSFEDTGAANYFLNLSQFPNIFFQLNAP